MHHKGFLHSGHWPTLLASFLYFDISFMVWGLLGVLVNYIVADLPLSASQKGFLIATPILGGALLRLPMGILADRWGGKRAGILGMVLTIVPLALGWLWADTYGELLFAGFLLGMAGASFAVALPLASRWYPLEHQGLALGIAGAGNSGTVIAALLAPRLAEVIGWQAVLAVAAACVLATLIAFCLLAKDSPDQPAPRKLVEYAAPLSRRDCWRFCAFYCVTFGGFVGLANFLTLFFHEQYEMSRVTAGTLTALCVFSGSMLRPVGGYLADRLGGARLLLVVFAAVAITMGGVAVLPPLAMAVTLMVVAMGLLGTGNGIVFQLIPQRFQREIGVVTGIVGAAGGVGGFILPSVLGLAKQWTGSFSLGLAGLSAVAFVSAGAVWSASRAWRLATQERLEPAMSS
ncbi:MAG TPA: nitrate/nitrite transporter [Pirellulaceae bacterium]|nr:nitrate/nitrite transporter [Pirellulaceae bacterium]